GTIRRGGSANLRGAPWHAASSASGCSVAASSRSARSLQWAGAVDRGRTGAIDAWVLPVGTNSSVACLPVGRQHSSDRERNAVCGGRGRSPTRTRSRTAHEMPDPGVSRPRYQGLAAARRWTHEPVRPRADFSLNVGDRVGDLTIIGHLARGRMTELYQVWSKEHWCALTGKLVAPDFLEDDAVPLSFRREEG